MSLSLCGPALRHTVYLPDRRLGNGGDWHPRARVRAGMVRQRPRRLFTFLSFFLYYPFLAQKDTRLIPPYCLAFFYLLVMFCLAWYFSGIAPGGRTRSLLPIFVSLESSGQEGRRGGSSLGEVHACTRSSWKEKKDRFQRCSTWIFLIVIAGAFGLYIFSFWL